MSRDVLHITMAQDEAARTLERVPPEYRGIVMQSAACFGPRVKCHWCGAPIEGVTTIDEHIKVCSDMT